jgi:hypothetical protein
MNTCPRDRALLLLAAGEGSPHHHRHIESCQHCTERYHRFARNLTLIEKTLEETSPPITMARLPVFSRWRWQPVAAALAAASLLIGGSWRLWTASSHPTFVASQDKEKVEQFWEEVLAPALFAETDTRILVTQSSPSNTAYLQAALDGGWPCEWQDNTVPPRCAAHSFPFVFDQQRQEVYYVSMD